MRKMALLYGATVVIIVGGAVLSMYFTKPVPIMLGEPFVLHMGESARYGDLTVKLVRRVRDSRCLQGAECEHPGIFLGEFELNDGKNKEIIYGGFSSGRFFTMAREPHSTIEEQAKAYHGTPPPAGTPHRLGRFTLGIVDVAPERTREDVYDNIGLRYYRVAMVVAEENGEE